MKYRWRCLEPGAMMSVPPFVVRGKDSYDVASSIPDLAHGNTSGPRAGLLPVANRLRDH